VAWLLEAKLRSVDDEGGQWERQEGKGKGEGVQVVKRQGRCVAGSGGLKGARSEATAYAGVTEGTMEEGTAAARR